MPDFVGRQHLLREIAARWNAGTSLRKIGVSYDRCGAWTALRLHEARDAGIPVQSGRRRVSPLQRFQSEAPR